DISCKVIVEAISQSKLRVMTRERQRTDEIVSINFPLVRRASVSCIPVTQQCIQVLRYGESRVRKDEVLSRVVDRTARLQRGIEEEYNVRRAGEMIIIVTACQPDSRIRLPEDRS